jgi:glycerol-3-phosphate acyltransferase PlsY
MGPVNFPFPSLALTGTLMVAAYLLGAVPWGLILARRYAAGDIRSLGSGNIGATNVARVAGKHLGILTLVLDMAKGGLPVYLTGMLMGVGPSGQAAMALVAASAFLGHLFPIYLKFKTGGKGVATAFGCFLVMSPAACLCSVLAFCLVFGRWRRVSAGSLAAAVVLPVAVFLWRQSGFVVASALMMAMLIFLRHGENIQRLIHGTEPAFGSLSKKKG